MIVSKISFGKISAGVTFAALLMLGAGAASAQDAPAAPPQEAAKPTDQKAIGDWTVRCFPVNSPSPCEMYEEADDKNSRQRILGVSIAYIPNADKHLIQIAVPLGISIPKGIVIKTDTFTSPALHYRRCDRAGCYVEMIMDNNTIDSLSHSSPNAAIKIVADNGKSFDLRFSLDGFAGAHDAMAALARQKVAKAPKPDAAQPAPAAPAP